MNRRIEQCRMHPEALGLLGLGGIQLDLGEELLAPSPGALQSLEGRPVVDAELGGAVVELGELQWLGSGGWPLAEGLGCNRGLRGK